MADNVSVTEGSGKTIATDDVGGVQYQVVKLATGADGVADLLSTSAPLPVSDAGGSFTVDNGGTFAVQATVAAAATNIAKAEDAASANADVGVPAMAIQKASPADTAGTDGDYAMLQMSAGRLWTEAIIEDGGNSITVDGAISFTAPQHIIVDSGTVTTVSTVTTITNVVHVDDNSGSLTVDNAGTFAVQATLAAGAATIAKAEDVASANADVGVPAMAIQKASPADTAGTDGDYAMLQMSAGRLWASATIDAAIPAGTNVIGHVIVDSGTVTTVSTLTTITNAVLVKGGTASDAALANAPVTFGGRATNTNLAEMSADGDVVDAQFTMQGVLVTAHAPRELLGNQQTQLSNTTTETTIVTAASSVFNDLYGLVLANTGASATKVSIRDDTAGTVRAIVYVPAGETRGFMLPAASALSQTATNKNWTAQCGTATTALEVTAMYVKRK